MSGSFASVRWNACVHLRLYSHPKEFWGNGFRTHVSSKAEGRGGGGGGGTCTRSSEEDRTHHVVSRRTASPTHCRLSYSGPQNTANKCLILCCTLLRLALPPQLYFFYLTTPIRANGVHLKHTQHCILFISFYLLPSVFFSRCHTNETKVGLVYLLSPRMPRWPSN